LLISIFEHSMDTFIQAVQKTLEGVTDAVEKLNRFIRLHLELVQNNQDVAQVLQIELRQSSKFMKEYAATKFRDYLDIISKILEEGQAQGVFSSAINPTIVKRTIFGAVDEMALDWVLMKKKKYTIQEVADQLCILFTNGLRV